MLIRRIEPDNVNLIYTYFNTDTVAKRIYLSTTDALFVSQQVLFTDGQNFGGSTNYISKYPNKSISEQYNLVATGLILWIIKFYAKFE